MVLEEAIEKASNSLKEEQFFQPFLLAMDNKENITNYKNDIEDSTKSYSLLEEKATELVKTKNIEIIVLVVDTIMPAQFEKDCPNSIRIHLEEKSQSHKKISARYLFVPYTFLKDKDKIIVNLTNPIPVSFPAEYIL